MIQVRAILVPTDFSGPATAAWEHAQWLATQLRSRIHLLHVVSPAPFDGMSDEAAGMQLGAIFRNAEQYAREQLQTMIPARGPLAKRVIVATASGPTVDGILHYAAANDIDLIVIGTHGRGAVGHLLLGSVAERCLQRATLPVLTVHDQLFGGRR
ncbi:MAG TPA: universal stress protein [Vicinamibacterales bacterium]|nr:universal stress protein [Vicinamibacterales bacterium]